MSTQLKAFILGVFKNPVLLDLILGTHRLLHIDNGQLPIAHHRHIHLGEEHGSLLLGEQGGVHQGMGTECRHLIGDDASLSTHAFHPLREDLLQPAEHIQIPEDDVHRFAFLQRLH